MFLSNYHYWKRRYPFAFIFSTFSLGIIWGYWQNYSCKSNMVLLVLALLIYFIFRKYNRNKKQIWWSIACQDLAKGMLLLGSGNAYFYYRTPSNDKEHISSFTEKIEAYKGIIIDELVEKKGSYRTLLSLESILTKGEWQRAYGKIQISGFGRAPDLKYGDKVHILGTPKGVEPPLNPYVFNEQLYLKTKGISHRHHIKKKSLEKLGQQKGRYFLAAMMKKIPQWCRRQIEKNIRDPEITALLLATLLGIRSTLDYRTQEVYAHTGVMHILAISGLHVGLLYFLFLLFFYLISFLFGRPNSYYKTALCSVWAYAFLTGLSPSVLRATGMLSLVHLGQWLRRDIIIENLLGAMAFLLLLYNPYWLFTLSFQLSFLACAGIILFYKPIVELFPIENPTLAYIWQISALSIAAQSTTLPLSLYYFHFFPTYFLLGNWIMLPLASVMLTGGLLILIIGGLSPTTSSKVAFFLEKILIKGNRLLTYISDLPYAKLGPLFLPTWALIGLYLTLGMIYWASSKRKKSYFTIAILLFSSTLAYWGWQICQESNKQKIIFYNVAPHQVISFIEKKKSSAPLPRKPRASPKNLSAASSTQLDAALH